jgi:hypothetical protein
MFDRHGDTAGDLFEVGNIDDHELVEIKKSDVELRQYDLLNEFPSASCWLRPGSNCKLSGRVLQYYSGYKLA